MDDPMRLYNTLVFYPYRWTATGLQVLPVARTYNANVQVNVVGTGGVTRCAPDLHAVSLSTFYLRYLYFLTKMFTNIKSEYYYFSDLWKHDQRNEFLFFLSSFQRSLSKLYLSKRWTMHRPCRFSFMPLFIWVPRPTLRRCAIYCNIEISSSFVITVRSSYNIDNCYLLILLIL